MTDAEHNFWTDRIAHYVDMGIALDIARRMAEEDLDLWREHGDEAKYDSNFHPEGWDEVDGND
jgi:hypothetical protein